MQRLRHDHPGARALSALTMLLLACLALAACGRSGPAPQPTADALPAVRYTAHLTAGELAPPGATLRNPHDGERAVAKSGGLLFSAMNCDGCHGTDGSGWVGPNLADRRWRYGGADAEVFNSIYFGRPKGMPAYGGAIGVDGVWSLVTYIRSLPPPTDIPTESWQQP
jgi:cytochrome c oxidase cbb3-type subunit III